MCEKLRLLNSVCKCGLTVRFNENRNMYQSVDEYIQNNANVGLEVDPEIAKKIIETDSIVELHFYPQTPVGFYHITHYNLDMAIDEAMEINEIKFLLKGATK